MIKKIVFFFLVLSVFFGSAAMTAGSIGGLGPWIGELGSGALVVLALFVMAKYIFKPMKELFKSLSKGLDKNTEALHKAVKNNEIIVANHLSSEKERWNHVITVLEPITKEIEELNRWHKDNGK